MEQEHPVLEAFFEKISSAIYSFSQKHNLLIDKYYHQLPNWSLRFKHPQGGVGNITIQKSGDCLWIGVSWWIDDYDLNTRHTKAAEIGECDLDVNLLYKKLKECLETILSWKKEELEACKCPDLRKKIGEVAECEYPVLKP
ncbi:MAG: hypothetical protein JW749_02525 [Sedimentisphaerales bacterium]|nr:hypothetical protein [Sedimentisphaerales bacterium]